MAQLRILEGSTFCICDEVGDIVEKTHGLFADDTRLLSRLCLTIDGKRPLVLSSGTVDYFSAACFLRNPVGDDLPLDAVSIKRERFVGDGMQDNVVLQNQTMEPVALRLELELGADFADVISVKEWDFSLGDPKHARPLPDSVEPKWDEENNQFVLTDPEGFARTQVILSERGEMNGHGIAYESRRELGTPPDLRHDFHAGRIAQARSGFRAHVEATAPAALDRLADELEHGPRTALLCLEEDAAVCHRRVLCEALAEYA